MRLPKRSKAAIAREGMEQVHRAAAISGKANVARVPISVAKQILLMLIQEAAARSQSLKALGLAGLSLNTVGIGNLVPVMSGLLMYC